jgi:hypothetical protein
VPGTPQLLLEALPCEISGVRGREERWLAAVALAALTLACSGDGEVGRPGVEDGTQNQVFCDASCARSIECAPPGSQEACVSYCVAAEPGLDRMRPEAVEVIANCVRTLSCSAYFGEEPWPCWEEAKLGVDTTAAARRFCKSWSPRWFECGSFYSVAECEFDWSPYQPSFLERLDACTKLDCAEFFDCVDAVLGLP